MSAAEEATKQPPPSQDAAVAEAEEVALAEAEEAALAEAEQAIAAGQQLQLLHHQAAAVQDPETDTAEANAATNTDTAEVDAATNRSEPFWA